MVYDVMTGAKEGNLDDVNNEMVTFRKTVEGYFPIPAMKGMLAEIRGDERWRNVRPPILPASKEKIEELLGLLGGTLHI